MSRKKLLLLFLASVMAHSARAQDAAPSNQTPPPDLAQLLEKIRSQETQLKQLESEVSQLKAAQESKSPAPEAAPAASPSDTTSAPAAVPAQEPAAPVPVVEEAPVAHEHTMTLPGGGPSLKIRAFGDINLGLGSDANPLIFPLPQPVHNTFQIGEFDLFLSSRLSKHVSGISEIIIGSDPTNFWGLDIERLQITYKANPYFEISAGRYHTSIGYYNTAFHHGTWFQTATGRPFMYYFEDSGGLLPVHSVGSPQPDSFPTPVLLNFIGSRKSATGAVPIPMVNPYKISCPTKITRISISPLTSSLNGFPASRLAVRIIAIAWCPSPSLTSTRESGAFTSYTSIRHGKFLTKRNG